MFASRRSTSRFQRLALPVVCAAALLLGGCRSQTPDEMYNEANQLFQDRKTAQGVLKLKDLVREHPQDPLAADARIMLARYYASEGNAQKALEELDAVVASTPFSDQRSQEALRGIIDIRMQLKDFAGALETADKAIAREKEAEPIITELRKLQKVTVLMTMGEDARTTEALGLLDELMLHSTDGSLRGQARETLAQFHRSSGDYDQSNAVYARYLAEYPQDPIKDQIDMAMAINLRQSGREEEAREAFSAAADRMSSAIEGELDKAARGQKQLELAMYYELFGELDTAETLMKKVMADNVGSRIAIDTQFAISRMYAMAGELDKATVVLEQIRKENAGTNIDKTAENLLKELDTIRASAGAPPVEPVAESAS